MMKQTQVNNPLHGITLQAILEQLVDKLGWDTMATHVAINCFKSQPSIKSSLTFLRKTPWAREQVEKLYLAKIAGQPQAKTTTQQPLRECSRAVSAADEFVWPTIKNRE